MGMREVRVNHVCVIDQLVLCLKGDGRPSRPVAIGGVLKCIGQMRKRLDSNGLPGTPPQGI